MMMENNGCEEMSLALCRLVRWHGDAKRLIPHSQLLVAKDNWTIKLLLNTTLNV
jgi:hypothetical protein